MLLTSGDCGNADGRWGFRLGAGEKTFSPLKESLAAFFRRVAAVKDMKLLGASTRLGADVIASEAYGDLR